MSIVRRSSRFLRQLLRRARDPYRPELHYMRGPGPRSRVKLQPS